MRKKLSKNIYYDNITYENMLKIWYIVRKTCNSRENIFYYSFNINTNLITICNKLYNKEYIPSKFKTFLIFEPKPRLIMNQTITDKIVNHFIVNHYLIPYLEKSLIDENIATRKNKGGSYGIKLLKEYFNKILINHKEVYCLKLDVSKYFYNIDHEILLNKIGKKILDKNVLELIKKIISETNNDYINNYIKYINFKYNLDIPYYKDNKGLSIGAETSQFFAIFYLNDLDHYIKEKLKCKYYIRYMDDLLILDNEKDNLINIFNSIKVELNKLKLKVNSKSNIYKCSNSFKFLGYKWQVINNKLVISSNNKTYYRIRRRLIKLENSDYLKYIKSKGSYCGYFKVINKEYGGVFKIKTIDLYNIYKGKYSDTIIFIKEGLFYKTLGTDAKIIWHLFNYKYVKDTVSFGMVPYNNVIMKLNELDISYVVVDKNEEIISNIKSNNTYSLYVEIANRHFDKYIKINNIHQLLDSVLKDENNYDRVYNYLYEIVKVYLIES